MQSKTIQIIDPKKLSKECRITFIIGNGFDLGMNMRTRYSDVYDGYILTPSASEVIARFKNELSEKAPHGYPNWSDFEMGMALYAKTLASENELVECVRDFKSYMVHHLQNEYRKILSFINHQSNVYNVINELERSILSFYGGLIPNVKNQLDSMIDGAEVVYNYITFNYTMTLEALFAIKAKHNQTFERTPIHIHGKLDSDVVLGIDNVDQLSGAPFSLTRKGHRAFVKTSFNEQYDKTRVEVAKKIISESSIICGYGFSMGESDKTWVDQLSTWLLENPNHHLVMYQYDENTYNLFNSDELMDVEDEKKVHLLQKLGIEDNTILNQIHIPVSYDIFNFKLKKVIGANTAHPPYIN
jgi:hypothetical protein